MSRIEDRADVMSFLAQLPRVPLPGSERARWQLYEAYKAELSRLVGWDAPTEERYDQGVYEEAVDQVARLLEL